MLEFLFTTLGDQIYIDRPLDLIGWVYWIFLLAILGWGISRARKLPQLGKNHWIILPILTVVVPFTSLFLGVAMRGSGSAPPPGIPIEQDSPIVMVLSAIPWILAGGLFSPPIAAIIGLLSGLIRSFFETHSLFTALEISALAVIYSIFVRQRYRNGFFILLRHPIIAAMMLPVVFIPYYLVTGFFIPIDNVAGRLDYSFGQVWVGMITRFIELIIGGIFGGIIIFVNSKWDGEKQLILHSSPIEKSIKGKYFFGVVPILLVFGMVLSVGIWFFFENISRLIIKDSLSTTAEFVSDSLPTFMETGQNFISDIADSEVLALPQKQMGDALAERFRLVPFFQQLMVFDDKAGFIGGFPINSVEQIQLTQEELSGIQFALKGIPVQSYIITPVQGENSTRLSFFGLVHDQTGKNLGVVIGRTEFDKNPFLQPLINSLTSIIKFSGGAMIIDDNSQVVYRSDNSVDIIIPNDNLFGQELFSKEVSLDGETHLVYSRSLNGPPWTIVLTVPVEKANQNAMVFALPYLITIAFLFVIIISIWGLVLGRISRSLRELAVEATYVSNGQLDRSIPEFGIDEVGQLSYSFEKMRISLKERIEELSGLLVINQAVASHLEAKTALKPIFEAILKGGADNARIVLESDIIPEATGARVTSFGAGRYTEQYAYLDEQIFDLMSQQDVLVIPNTVRIRRIQFTEGHALGALMAVQLKIENHYYGALWVAYYDQHNFTDSEMRFFTTLANQATLAAANARLYASAEIGRRRLEAVLASTPDPVLVIDERMQLILINPAAMQIPGLIKNPIVGKPINEVVASQSLLEFLAKPVDDAFTTKEISLSHGKVFNACISPVMTDNRLDGKICILRDVTHYKELDKIKSEFVSTVSHDLRSPLSLMRGYVTMLQMVGDLNAQQKGYLVKIVQGVDNMMHLVNNLLDLGRIEAGVGLRVERIFGKKIIENVITLLQPMATQKKIQLQFDGTNSPSVVIEADPALLQQALYNLIENAIRYTQVGGQVNASLEIKPSSIVFGIIDTGIGIAPLDQPHIFEKFYRSERREAYQIRGTGLGLAIVKSIAERHKGHVWVESQLGKGSEFYFELPYRVS